MPLLHEPHAVQRRPVVVRVDGDVDPLADEQELEHGDVPAERAAPKRARAEERAAERPESLARARVGEARAREPVRSAGRRASAATVFGPETASIGPR